MISQITYSSVANKIIEKQTQKQFSRLQSRDLCLTCVNFATNSHYQCLNSQMAYLILITPLGINLKVIKFCSHYQDPTC